jgi:hypothetical protein
MSRVSRDFTQEVADLRAFLLGADWLPTKETSSLSFYAPPESLGIKGRFTVALPTQPGARGTDVLVNEAIAVLQELYGFRFSELLAQVANKSEILGSAQLSVRFVGNTTNDGGIPLKSLKGFVEHLLKGLYHSAKLRLDGSSDGPANPSAEEMANDARFLQTEAGSFIAKIEVPFSVLQQQDLFGRVEITSHDVCSHLLSGLSFINERILQGDVDFQSDEVITESINLFDPGLLEDYEKIVTTPRVEVIELEMLIGSQRRSSSTGFITEERINRLREFADFFKRHFTAEDEIEILGTVVELRSRDPAGDRNYARVVADFYGDRTYFGVPLTNEQYQVAVDAHRSKRLVKVRGNGTRLRTQVRINRVTLFEAVEVGRD